MVDGRSGIGAMPDASGWLAFKWEKL